MSHPTTPHPDVTKALALLAHATAAASNSRALLASMYANWQHQTDSSAEAGVFDELALAMLRAISSAAIKQHPNDAEVQEIYRLLRPGERH